MAGRGRGVGVLALAATAVLVTGLLSLAGSLTADAATVTCPTVGAGGLVTPAPTPRVDWSGCDLTGANLSGASLSQADLAGAKLTNADVANANLFAVVLAQADLSGADLSGAYLRDANLEKSNLTSASLTSASLAFTHLQAANLSAADFTGALMTDVVSGGQITASPAPTLPPGWQLLSGYLIGPGSGLGNAALSGLDLSSADLAGAFLDNANLSGANLSGANLSGSYLDGAQLADANLDKANLTGASLYAVRSGGIVGSTSLLPAGWSVASGFLVGPGADLQHDNAAGADFAGADLNGADLYGTILANANLSHANLTGVQAAGIDLQNANLTDANLTDASIAGAGFGAGTPDLAGADFAGATMTGIITADIGAGPAILPANWTYADGFLLGPTADLKDGYILANTDLTGVDLAFANLGHTQFEHDNLTRANLRGTNPVAGSFFADTWSDTICPDGTNSNLYVAGCFSARLYAFAGLISPRPGSTVRTALRHFTVRFRLDNPLTGQPISTAEAMALSAGRDVRAVLAGPHVSRYLVRCGWSATEHEFSCTFGIPRRVRTGRAYSYSITIEEKQGAAFVVAPAAGRAANPAKIHFQ